MESMYKIPLTGKSYRDPVIRYQARRKAVQAMMVEIMKMDHAPTGPLKEDVVKFLRVSDGPGGVDWMDGNMIDLFPERQIAQVEIAYRLKHEKVQRVNLEDFEITWKSLD